MLSKIDRELNEKLMACSIQVKRRHGNYATQRKILELLIRQDGGPISQKSLQEQLGIKPGSMSEVTIKLENKGYVKRERSQEDLRSVDILLTEEGKQIYQSHSETEHDSPTLFAALNRTEKRQLSELLGKLLDHWENGSGKMSDRQTSARKRRSGPAAAAGTKSAD